MKKNNIVVLVVMLSTAGVDVPEHFQGIPFFGAQEGSEKSMPSVSVAGWMKRSTCRVRCATSNSAISATTCRIRYTDSIWSTSGVLHPCVHRKKHITPVN